jgi:hypothetical protein
MAVRSREDVWEAFADLFLDTETRPEIPRAALTCVEAGMSREEAFEAWAYEVTPAVWWNGWSVVGEWAGWDRDALFARIRDRRVKPSKWAYVVYRCRVHAGHAEWVAIGRCMDVLHQAPEKDRDSVSSELTWLARQFFDFMSSMPPPSSVQYLRSLYDETFLPIFAPIVFKSSTASQQLNACTERVERALR